MRAVSLSAAVVAAAALATAAPARAQDGAMDFGAGPAGQAGDIYVEPRFGVQFLSEQATSGTGLGADATFDVGFTGGLSAGYHVLDDLRIELEGVADTNDVEEISPVPSGLPSGVEGLGDVITYGGFVNLAYDIRTGTAFVPFVAAGGGVLRIDTQFDALGVDDTDTVPAWQARAGVGWHVTETTALALSYRYRGASDPEFDTAAGTVETEYQSHALELSLRYRF